MKEENKEYLNADYLYEHSGTVKYEVVELIDKVAKIVNPNEHSAVLPVVFFDTINRNIIVKSKDKTAKGNPSSSMWKINKEGKYLDSINRTGRILYDGTLLNSDDYREWIVNGRKNTCKIDYNKLNDKGDWLRTFNNNYLRAEYVYLYKQFNEYLFKIGGKWHQLNDDFKIINQQFKAKYPAKEDNDVRMIELEDLCPSFWSNPKTRDVSLIRELDYEVVDFEKGKGLNPINYSAGNYYFEVYMPGETITFKRYGAMGEHIKLYKIPTEYGGREDVLFIVLEPRNSDARQASGMYVIRPRGIAKEKEAAL